MIAIVEDPDCGLPADAIATLKVLVVALAHLEAEIGNLDAEIASRAKDKEVVRRLMTIPSIGPLIAAAITVLAPPPETIRKARDFATWLGLSDATAAFDRRQAAARGEDEDGRTISEAVADHRRQQCHNPAARPCCGATEHLAGRGC